LIEGYYFFFVYCRDSIEEQQQPCTSTSTSTLFKESSESQLGEGTSSLEKKDDNRDPSPTEAENVDIVMQEQEPIVSSKLSESEFDVESELSCDPSDYSSKKLSAELIHFLLSKKENMSLLEKHQHAIWRYREYADGSKKERNWLVYSKKKASLFCLPCMIFGSPNTTGMTTNFATKGYSDWVNVSRDVNSHDKSTYHGESNLALIRWNSGNQRIDKERVAKHNARVLHYRAVVSVVIDCARYLTEEMMAFRNSTEGKGKLINLFRLLAKYNPDACVYLEKIKKS
jgi:hypothetical protein